MQSTGQTSTHARSLTPMHGSAMTYVMPLLPLQLRDLRELASAQTSPPPMGRPSYRFYDLSIAMICDSRNGQLSAAPRNRVARAIARSVEDAARRPVRRLCQPTHSHPAPTTPTDTLSAHQ